MDMDHLIGQRFNLISKSEIRYVGTLHEINPEQSTIALEDVFSFGTEGRKVDNFIPPSQQKFDYIVFRGSDVKDIKIAEDEKEAKQPSPPNIPNDPAILNSSRPGPPQPRGESPFPPPGYPPQPHFGGYYPPQQFGRGFGPPPGNFGQGPGFPPYGPPPPGYFGPPSQGFPPGPGQFQQPPPPIGPQGQRNTATPDQAQPQQQPQERKAPGPVQILKPTSELPVDNRVTQQAAQKSAPSAPQEPKPAIAEDTPSAASTSTALKAATAQAKSNKVTPAVPFTVNQKSFAPPVPVASDGPLSGTNGAAKPAAKAAPTQVAMDEAARQAKEAVAAAMAKLNPQAAIQAKPAPSSSTAVDALSRKLSEMGPTSNGTGPGTGTHRGRGGFRGARGNYQRGGSGGPGARKIEIPKSDFDFESANAKFNKDDLIKEAIAAESPVAEKLEEGGIEETAAAEIETSSDGPNRKDSITKVTGQAYNKSTSFFDNISSEAKDREEVYDTRGNARHMRSEEYKKNVETFGQGNIDGGYRGRGRGGFGRGRQYGGNYRGSNRGYGPRGRGRGGAQAPNPAQAQASTES